MRDSFRLVGALVRTRHKRGQVLLFRELRGWIRIEFLGFAVQSGLIAALKSPQTIEDLAARLEVTNQDFLASILELGASLDELLERDGVWSLRGTRARALADPSLDGLAGLLGEATSYDSDVYKNLLLRLRGAEPGDYLAEGSETVARASRVAEIVLEPFVHSLVRSVQPRSVLDVGCGSGTYMRATATASASAQVVGIDSDPRVASEAKRNLERWGLSARCTVRDADVLEVPAELAGPWDLIFLFQNIYYFAAAEWPALLSTLRRLAPAGLVVIVTAVSGTRDPIAAHLDVVLRSTAGNYPLPKMDEIRSALARASFSKVDVRRLAPRQPLRAFIAR